MKKHLALIMALVMVLGSFSFVSAAPDFSDVMDTPYEEAVMSLELLNVLKGYPDGTFKPANTITRAEFAAVAVRVSGLEQTAMAAKGLPTGFNDVPAWHWASGYVGTAAKSGIVNGIGNGLFAPETPVKYEEAVTMLVRALGYEPMAEARGGYPFGHLIVANEIDLLDGAMGTQGTWATRGFVAQITFNALEIPMMIQTGYGSETLWVVSGDEDTDEKYLLDGLGFDSVMGRVTKVSSNRRSVTVTVEDSDEAERLGIDQYDTEEIELPEGFDVYETEGLETKFWYNDDMVISKVLEEAKYDAFTYFEDSEELLLITEDEEYDISDDDDEFYDITIDDDDFKDLADGAEADYAKVVLDNQQEVVWAQGFTFDGFIVVEEVEDETAIMYDDYDEVDLEDYLIVKEGNEITVEDIEEGDVLYYNIDEEFAVVSNMSKTGEVETVYTAGTEIKFAGETYDIAEDALYLDNDGVVDVLYGDADIQDDLKEFGEELTMFFNFKNEVVLAIVGDVTGTSDYYVLIDNSNAYEGRSGWMVSLDVRNNEGNAVSFDLDVDFVDKNDDAGLLEQDDFDGNVDYPDYTNFGEYDSDTVKDNMEAIAKKLSYGKVVEITLDSDGDPTEVVIMAGEDGGTIATDDDEVTIGDFDYRLNSSTAVFYDDTDEAILFGAAIDEFDELEDTTVYAEDGDIVAIVGETESDTSTVSGVLMSKNDVMKDTDGYLEFTLDVNGREEFYVTEDDDYTTDMDDFAAGDVIDLEVSDSTGKVDSFTWAKKYNSRVVLNALVTDVTGVTIETEDGTFDLISGGEAYDLDLEEIRLSDLEGKTVDLYRDGTHARYVQYVFIVAEDDEEPIEEVVAELTYIDGTIAAGTDVVAKVELPAGNTTVYKVVAYNSNGTVAGTVSTLISKDVIATDLGITTAGTADETYVVRAYKVVDGNDVELSNKVVTTKDMVAASLTEAKITTAAGAAVPAEKAKLTIGTSTIEVKEAGVAGDGYDFRFVEDALLVADTAEVTVNGKVVLVKYYGNVTVADLNSIPALSGLFTATGTDNIASTANGLTAGGVDAKAATGPVLTLTFDKAMTAASTVTVSIGANDVVGAVEWDTANKVATVTFAADAENVAEIAATKTITELDLVTKNGVELGTLSTAITN